MNRHTFRVVSTAIFAVTLVTGGCSTQEADPSEAGESQLKSKGGASRSGDAPHQASTIRIAGIPNFRDVGGKQAAGGWVATGHVFRSEQLEHADTDAFEALGIQEIIDFRGKPEVEDAPDPALPPATRVSLPIYDEDRPEEDPGVQLRAKLGTLTAAKSGGDAEELEAVRADLDAWSATLKSTMVHSYERMITDPRALKQFGTYLEHVASGKVVSFHCVSGKDRTGLAAALLLRGVGVPWATVREDYLRSNESLAEDIEEKLEGIGKAWTEEPGHTSVTTLRVILGVDEAFLNAAFAKIQEEYGGGTEPKPGEVASDAAIASFYAKVFGEDLQERLKARLLEE